MKAVPYRMRYGQTRTKSILYITAVVILMGLGLPQLPPVHGGVSAVFTIGWLLTGVTILGANLYSLIGVGQRGYKQVLTLSQLEQMKSVSKQYQSQDGEHSYE